MVTLVVCVLVMAFVSVWYNYARYKRAGVWEAYRARGQAVSIMATIGVIGGVALGLPLWGIISLIRSL